MLEINKFILKDVRCFKGAKEFNIRPLTFLVGENSTGKSTVLGCFQAMTKDLYKERFSDGYSSIDFNLKPFQIESFEDIVRKPSPKDKEFELGFGLTNDNNTASKFELLITFTKRVSSGNSMAKKIRFVFDDGEIIFFDGRTAESDEEERDDDEYDDESEIKTEERGSKKIFTILLGGEYQLESVFALFGIWHYIQHYKYFYRTQEELSPEEKELIEFIKDKDIKWSSCYSSRYFGFSPTQPEPPSTYDPLNGARTSSGCRIPLKLTNLSLKDPEHWGKLYDSLRDFGKASGLFTDLEIENFRVSLSKGSLVAPLQLDLELRKEGTTNLTDVGCDISRILPLLAHILIEEEHIFLMQQPEVYLHPQAQAAFTSLLAELAKQKNHTFIIETYSDCMIDRALIGVMNDDIQTENVSLIHLEKQDKNVEVHNLRFDKQGYFEDDPPDGYPDSFLSETHKLLGWEN